MQQRLPHVYFGLRKGVAGFWQALNSYAKKHYVEGEVQRVECEKEAFLGIATAQISDNALKEMFGVSFYAFTPSESLGIPIPRDLEPYVKFIEVESVKSI